MKDIEDFQERVGYTFKDPDLLLRALTHPSYANERDLADNQRLEFLGDAVVDLVASEILLQTCPEAPEGELSRRRAAMVNEGALAEIARRIGIEQVVRLGRNERRLGVSSRPSVLADAVEALAGAVFLEAGYLAAAAMVRGWFTAEMGESFKLGDPKSRLQEWAQKQHQTLPVYRVEKEEGPPHARTYTVSVGLLEQVAGRGTGRSKKEAELKAAAQALLELPDA
jgi:ribonuclease III